MAERLILTTGMPEAITFERVGQRFRCGKDDGYANLMVVKILGPAGAKACAYCCNMNIDMDGEVQAYGPLYKPGIKPIDKLGDAGWLSEADNAVKKALYEQAKKTLAELEKIKLDLDAKAKAAADLAKSTPTATTPAPDAAMIALNKQIAADLLTAAAAQKGDDTKITALKAEAKKAIQDGELGKAAEILVALATKAMKSAARYWDKDPRPVHFEKKFWDWYGLMALTPAEANSKTYYETITDPKTKKVTKVLRRPELVDKGKTSFYEDVYGKFPVVQSAFEPGPGYFVSAFPRRVNEDFPDWDQRSYLPFGTTTQVPNAALSTVLEAATGVHLKDMVLAIRLDTGNSLAFPFLDRGFEPKVGECSIGAFVSLGGVVAANVNASKNDFLLLYLAFANSAGQTPESTLAKFASAANAEDLPIVLAFIAQATLNAKIGSRTAVVRVGGDPLEDFKKWKKSASTILPSTFDVINQALSDAGFSPFAQRFLKKRHPSAAGGPGPWLKPPENPWKP